MCLNKKDRENCYRNRKMLNVFSGEVTINI
jgi:hypothetical protein